MICGSRVYGAWLLAGSLRLPLRESREEEIEDCADTDGVDEGCHYAAALIGKYRIITTGNAVTVQPSHGGEATEAVPSKRYPSAARWFIHCSSWAAELAERTASVSGILGSLSFSQLYGHHVPNFHRRYAVLSGDASIRAAPTNSGDDVVSPQIEDEAARSATRWACGIRGFGISRSAAFEFAASLYSNDAGRFTISWHESVPLLRLWSRNQFEKCSPHTNPQQRTRHRDQAGS